MKETEKLLHICADTLKMPGWNDALSMLTEQAERSVSAHLLDDDELANVAGGVPAAKKETGESGKKWDNIS